MQKLPNSLQKFTNSLSYR